MATAPQLRQTQRQRLALTPSLRQSLAMLRMGSAELAALLADALETNPALENDAKPQRLSVRIGGAAGFKGAAAPMASPVLETRRGRAGPAPGPQRLTTIEAIAERAAARGDGPTSLAAHLEAQLPLLLRQARERQLGLALIAELDAAGYLRADLAKLARREGCATPELERVLEKLQQAEPAGLFARDLEECLRLQAADRGWLDRPMRELLKGLALLGGGETARLQRELGLDAPSFERLLRRLKSLDPKPGHSFDLPPTRYVEPDLILEAVDDGYRLRLADEASVALSVTPLAKTARAAKLDRRFAQARSEARWLVETLARRNATLLQLGALIFERQIGFFAAGPAALQPLTRRALAAALALHETTIGRLAQEKYVLTPAGTFALGAFLASPAQSRRPASPRRAKPSTIGPVGFSGAAARARLAALIAGAGARWSDKALAERLAADGYPLARRTIAKYRKILALPPGRRR